MHDDDMEDILKSVVTVSQCMWCEQMTHPQCKWYH